MSKSKGNVVVPTEILDKFGADAVRWRAAMARPGHGLPVRRDPDEGRTPPGDEDPQRVQVRARHRGLPVGPARAMPSSEPGRPGDAGRAAQVVDRATAAFEAFDYTAALEVAEKFFWTFCDDYLELVKERAYGAQGRRRGRLGASGPALALDVQLRLFAPFMPFVTEEVWSWWQPARCTTPPGRLAVRAAHRRRRGPAGGRLGGADRPARRQVAAKVSMKTPLASVTVEGPPTRSTRLRAVEDDLRAVGRIASATVTGSRWGPADGNRPSSTPSSGECMINVRTAGLALAAALLLSGLLRQRRPPTRRAGQAGGGQGDAALDRLGRVHQPGYA
jgi:valyl-tRNA synthetase